MWWVGAIVVSTLISLIFKLSNKSHDDVDVRGQMIDIVHEFPNYSSNAAYYTDLVDRYHHQAFEDAYSMGGRHTGAQLDAKVYLVKISALMARKATSDGKTEIAKTLTVFNQALQQSAK